jgi:hypothetical protein
MPILTETSHPGGFLVWEALRDYCRSTIILASGNLLPGTILGKITASGKYVAHDPAASNGTQTAAAILWDSVDASGGDTNAVVVIRGPAIVNQYEISIPGTLTGPQIAAAHAALLTLGILVR